jgi:leucyl aminopeptidase
MNHLTIDQVTACVNSATRVAKTSVAIDYDTLTEALNAALDSDLTGLPEAHQAQWCDVCQRSVETNHAHDQMVQTSDHHHSPLGRRVRHD